MARYTLPSLLQGHPPSQSSGTLMSLQEGIAVLRARMGLQQAPRPPYRTTAILGCQPSFPGELSAVPNRSIPSPPPRTLFPSRASRGSFPNAQPHPTSHHREGERGRGEAVCSVATSGCPTRSEDGFPAGARNIPPRPVQPKRHPKLLAQPPPPTQNKKPLTI